jgi:dTDP-glucose pyrophosphorylase
MLIDLSTVCVRPSDSLLRVMEVIEKSSVEIALVVDEGGRLLGTITDGDVRREVLKVRNLESLAGRIATSSFVRVGPEVSDRHVLELMIARQIKTIPVTDPSGRLIGLHRIHDLLRSSQRPNSAVVMAGGKGERMRPLTQMVPKPMLPVGDRPLLERIVAHLVSHGIRRIYLAVNYLGQVIEDHFGSGSQYGCAIEYLRETKALGTAGPLSLLPSRPEHSLLVMNGDLLTSLDVGRVLDFHESGGWGLTVVVRSEGFRIPFGVVHADENEVRSIREKPTLEFTVNAGIYALCPAVLERVPADTPYPMTDLLQACLESGERVGAYRMEESWTDLGSRGPDDLGAP